MYGLPKVGQIFNIYGFKLVNNVWYRVPAHLRARVHHVIPGRTAITRFDVCAYYKVDARDFQRITALTDTARHRVVFTDKDGRFHPYFWNENNKMHHQKFVEVVDKEVYTFGEKYFPILEETGESLEDLGNGDIEPKPISQPDNAKINLNTEIEHYVAAHVAAKLAAIKRQDEASLFGEVARLSAELAALKSALTAAFPTIIIK